MELSTEIFFHAKGVIELELSTFIDASGDSAKRIWTLCCVNLVFFATTIFKLKHPL